jgi:hypothetical protein
MVIGALLLALTVQTSTGTAYQTAAALWEQNARDERSAHKTTQIKLDVVRADLSVCLADSELAITPLRRNVAVLSALAVAAGSMTAAIGVVRCRDPTCITGTLGIGAGLSVGGLAGLAWVW